MGKSFDFTSYDVGYECKIIHMSAVSNVMLGGMVGRSLLGYVSDS